MKDISVLLLALPAIVLVGFTVYTKNIHQEMSKEYAVMAGLTYGVLAAVFFVLVYLTKFVTAGSAA